MAGQSNWRLSAGDRDGSVSPISPHGSPGLAPKRDPHDVRFADPEPRGAREQYSKDELGGGEDEMHGIGPQKGRAGRGDDPRSSRGNYSNDELGAGEDRVHGVGPRTSKDPPSSRDPRYSKDELSAEEDQMHGIGPRTSGPRSSKDHYSKDDQSVEDPFVPGIGPRTKDPRRPRDQRDSRDPRTSGDVLDSEDPFVPGIGPRTSKDPRGSRDPRDSRDPRTSGDVLDSEDPFVPGIGPRTTKDPRGPRDPRASGDVLDSRDHQGSKDGRDSDPRSSRDRLRDHGDPHDTKAPRDSRDQRDTRDRDRKDHEGRSDRGHRDDKDRDRRDHRDNKDRDRRDDKDRDRRDDKDRDHRGSRGGRDRDYRDDRDDKDRSHRDDKDRSHRDDKDRSHRDDKDRSHRDDKDRGHREDKDRSHRDDKDRDRRDDRDRSHRDDKDRNRRDDRDRDRDDKERDRHSPRDDKDRHGGSQRDHDRDARSKHDEPRAPVKPSKRYFPNDAPPKHRNPFRQLEASLQRLVTQHPPSKVLPGGGLYYGPVSISYLFFVLQPLYPTLQIEDRGLGEWSAEYLARAQKDMMAYPGPERNKCGVSDDIMAMLALDAISSRDPELVRELCDFADVVTEQDASNEWLYGRAGYLYLLRLVKACFAKDREVKELVDETADEIIDEIMESPRPWKWHGKPYVGAAHGIMGIITQIVLTDPAWAPRLEGELSQLLSLQLDSGNWPASVPSSGGSSSSRDRDRLVQVCHGAPGIVISLLAVRPHFPRLHERIDRAVARGQRAVKERGLLTKEPCLCHGISGNALALEGRDFENFLSYTTGGEMRALEKEGLMERSDDPSGLWTGEAGRAWVWAVADKGLDKRLLGYNDV